MAVKEDYASGDAVTPALQNANGNGTNEALTGFGITNTINSIPGQLTFGGDGSDGALTISSGTTNLTAGTWYQYSSIAITGTASISLASNGAGLSGTILIKCSGDCTISSSGASFNLADLGADGGALGVGTAGGDGTAGGMTGQTAGVARVKGVKSTSGNAMNYPPSYYGATFMSLNNKTNLSLGVFGPGSGGAGGNIGGTVSGGGGGSSAITDGTDGVVQGTTAQGTSGEGGKGGGAIYLEILGAFTFSGTIDVSGEDGGDASAGNAGGGGGGGAGVALIVVTGVVTDTGTKTVTGGAVGALSGTGGNGGAGGVGQVLVVAVEDEGTLF